MSSRLTMAREGSLFCADGYSLSWPEHGVREVIDVPEEKRSQRLRRVVFEGKVIETDLLVTARPGSEPVRPRLLQGEEARRHFSEPAGPVVRVVSEPAVIVPVVEVNEYLTSTSSLGEATAQVAVATKAPAVAKPRGRPKKTA